MNYKLNTIDEQSNKGNTLGGIKRLIPLMHGEGRQTLIAFTTILVSSATSLITPIIIAHTVDTYIRNKDFHGVLAWSLVLFAIYCVGLGASYIQTITMGSIGRRVLFNLRNTIFNKLQELPVAFFNQNKAGDLISRINNDTDKLNQFFAQALMQFVGNAFLILGAGILLIVLNPRLGAAALLPAVVILGVTQIISPWVNRVSFKSLQALGGMSGEIQESINNFKVIVAFNRLDYFRNKFDEANQKNFKASVTAGIASNIFTPLYGLAYNFGQLIVLAYGIYLISTGMFTVGLLIGFLLYVNSFYNPLRQLATVWSSLQLALAGLERISEVLALKSDMITLPNTQPVVPSAPLLAFNNVSFKYPDSGNIISDISFELLPGKVYALVGPTGGGKTTTASLMARLYDPTEGTILLNGRDIRGYSAEERGKYIGFILQEPFLFTGTVRENIIYGNTRYHDYSNEQLLEVLKEKDLTGLLARFEEGLSTPISSSGDMISLGQKQLIAFIRAILREPELLILDEATANIDTVTEELLENILEKLPKTTTKVIIAHRLNTIENADDIFFVNGGEITRAGSLQNALDLLLHGKRAS
ncbi:MAG: multidrug transporter [Candidatus Kaiserbacteria bacterium]|nr:multidrug transporter [Candidatus Kaiserbacteria bacterium]